MFTCLRSTRRGCYAQCYAYAISNRLIREISSALQTLLLNTHTFLLFKPDLISRTNDKIQIKNNFKCELNIYGRLAPQWLNIIPIIKSFSTYTLQLCFGCLEKQTMRTKGAKGVVFTVSFDQTHFREKHCPFAF